MYTKFSLRVNVESSSQGPAYYTSEPVFNRQLSSWVFKDSLQLMEQSTVNDVVVNSLGN